MWSKKNPEKIPLHAVTPPARLLMHFPLVKLLLFLLYLSVFPSSLPPFLPLSPLPTHGQQHICGFAASHSPSLLHACIAQWCVLVSWKLFSTCSVGVVFPSPDQLPPSFLICIRDAP
jgi:hypothetical protein